MVKRTLLLLICLLIASSLFIILDGGAADVAEGANIHVPRDYSTIQAAVQAANPRDNILVSDGTYSEAVMVRKMINIVGQSSTNTIINSPASWCIRIQTNNVQISNLKLRLASNAGLWIEANNVKVTNVFCARNNVGMLIDDVTNAQVLDSVCYLNTAEGMRLYTSDDCIIDNVTFRQNNEGVSIEGGDGNTFEGCDIVDNTVVGCVATRSAIGDRPTDLEFIDTRARINGDRGFSIADSQNVRLVNCTIFENEGTGVMASNIQDIVASACHVHNNSGLGLSFRNNSYGENVLVENCRIEDNHQPSGGWTGVLFYNMRDVTVANTTIRKSLRGISFYESRNCLCINNTIVGVMATSGDVDSTGVYVGYLTSPGPLKPSDISIIDTSISTVLQGVHIGEVVGITIRNVTISEFARYGVYGEYLDFNKLPVTDGRISGCRISGGSTWAQGCIQVDASSGLIVENCDVKNGSFSLDIGMSGATGNAVRNNTVKYCGNGIRVLSTGVARIKNNTVTDVSFNGIFITGSRTSKVDVKDNVLLRTALLSTVSYSALRMVNIGGSTVENNLISDTAIGIYLSGAYCLNNVVLKNTVRDCSSYGVLIENDPGPNTFYLNNFVNNTDYISIDQDNEVFDNGALGNYWGNYTLRYPDAKIVGKVWDTPYVVPGFTAQDNYPLAYPYDTVPPVADAGEDRRVLAGTILQFDGTGSSDDWGIINYTWSFTYEGAQVEVYGEEPTFTFLRIGDYDVTLTIMDGWDNSDMTTMTVEVYDDQPPVADAGEDITVDMDEEFTLDGSASMDNGIIVGWSWLVEPQFLLRPLTFEGEMVDVTLADAGDYMVILNVTDETGNWALDRITVHVMDIEPPVADAGKDQEAGQGDQVELNGTASMDNVGIASWVWTFEDEGPVTLEGETTEYVFTEVGEYTVTLNVTDAAGNWDTDTMTVTVTDGTPPEADGGQDQEVEPGTEVTLDGMGSSDNVGIVSWKWTFEDDGPISLEGEVVKYTFDNQGRFDVTLTVADAAGNTDTDEVAILVGDGTPPVADAGEDQEVDQGTEVTLDGTGSSDNVAVVSWKWTFEEDGGTVTLEGATPKHTFELAGEFEITLEVADEVGNTDTDTVTITVRDTESPVADAGEDITIDEGNDAEFDGSGSTDNVGIESYVWTFEYEGSEESLEGMEAIFTFEVGGSYEVTLTVTDEAGNEDTDVVVLRVFGEQRPWRLGPFEDKEGNPIGGVRVEVRLNGTRYTDSTDDEGYIEMSVPAVDLISPATVKATKEGWKDLEFEMPLDDLGDPDGDIPPMEREEEDEPGVSLIWPFLLTIALVIVALFVVFNRMNQGNEVPGEDEPEEDEAGDEGLEESS